MSYDSEVLADSPALFYLQAETSGNLADSGSLNKPVNSFVGTPTYAQTGPDGAASAIAWPDSFVTETYAQSGTIGGTAPTAATLEGWFYLPSSVTKDTLIFGMGYGHGNTSARPLLLFIRADGKIALWWGTSTTITRLISSASAVSTGAWHHVAATVSSAGAKIRLNKVDVATVGGSTSLSLANTAMAQMHTGGVRALTIFDGGVNGGTYNADLTDSSPIRIARPAFYASALSDTRIDAHKDAMSVTTIVTPGQPSEADTALAATAKVGVLRTTGQPAETDTALSATPLVGQVITAGRALETDSAMAASVELITPITVAAGRAVETDSALSPTALVATVASTGQASETNQAIAATALVGQTISAGQASETDTALAASVVETTGGLTEVDLSTFIEFNGSTTWDGTSLAPAVDGDYAVFTFPLRVEAGTSYDIEVDYASGDDGGVTLYAVAGLTQEEVDSSNFYQLLTGGSLTGSGTLTATWGPGVGDFDLALAAGEAFVLFETYGVAVTGVRTTPALTAVEPPVVPPTAGPDTENDAYKLTLGGWGVATWEPAPVPVPAVLGVVRHSVISAIAYGPVTMVGTQPVFTYSEADTPRMRERVLLGGRDVTYDRGVPTPEVEYELADLLLYGPASLDLPAYMASWETGTAALDRASQGRRVKVQLVDDTDPAHPTVAATIYKGFVEDPNVSGRNLSLELAGEAQGRLALRDSHVLFKRVHDISRLLWAEFRDVGVRYLPRLGEPGIGIDSLNFGSESKLEKVEELVARMVKKDGTQRAILPDAAGDYRITDKDTTTTHYSVFVDDSFTVAELSSDLAEKPNAIYATAIAPNGMRIDGAAVGGLVKTPAPDYPMDDNSNFGEGTTNEDTDSGDGVSIIVNRLGSVGLLDIRDTPGGFDDDVADALAKLQNRARITGPVGVMTPALWRALWDLDVTGRDPSWATIQPTAQDPSTQRYLRAASGAPVGLNPDFDSDVIQVDESIDMGSGFRERQVQNWSETRVHAPDERVWYGTITLHMGAVLAGQVEVGDTITATDLVDARLVQPGRHNLYVPNFDGGTLFGVSGAQRNGDTIVFTVDTRHRPAREIWERRQVRRETRSDPARRMMGNRQSTQRKDAVRGFISWGGILDRDVALTGGEWTKTELVVGDYGTLARFRTVVQSITTGGGEVVITGHEHAVCLFGKSPADKQMTEARLNDLVPAPLAENGDRPWRRKATRDILKAHGFMEAWGTHEEPAGYGGDLKTDAAPLTGVEEVTDIPFEGAEGYRVDVFVWVATDTKLRSGRMAWPLLEGGV